MIVDLLKINFESFGSSKRFWNKLIEISQTLKLALEIS